MFIGSANIRRWLRDTAGNRRWWPIPIRAGVMMPVAETDRLRDQLWAEAATAYRSVGDWRRIPDDLQAPTSADTPKNNATRPIVDALEAVGWEKRKVRLPDGSTQRLYMRVTASPKVAEPGPKPIVAPATADPFDPDDVIG